MNKKDIRITLLISADKMPEWHAFLSKVQNYHFRAEILRAHLMKPGSVNIFNQEMANAVEEQNHDELPNHEVNVDTEETRPEEENARQEEIPREDGTPGTDQDAQQEKGEEFPDNFQEIAQEQGPAEAEPPQGITPEARENFIEENNELASSIIRTGGEVRW